MATLAAVNKTLLEVSNNTKETSRGISAFVKYIEKQKSKDLEAEREAKSNQAKLNKAENQNNRSSGSSSKGGGFFSGLTPGKAGLIGAAAALGPKIASSILRRLPGVALIGFADQIADSLLGPNFEQDTKDTLSRGLQGGGLGMLLGKRFILPFAALNALATDENKKMLKDIGSNLKENWDGFAKQVAPVLGFLPSFDNILKTISTGTTNGLKAIKGFTESGFQSEEFKTNWVSGVGLLGTVAALLMPGKFAKGLKFLARFAGSKKGAVLLALAGGTFIYDKFFNKDGSALESGAAVVGTTALGYGGYKAIQGSYNVFKNRVSPGHPSQKAKAGSMVLSKKGNAMVAGKDGKATTQPFKGSQNKYPRLFGSKGFLSGIKGIAPLAVIGAAFAGNEVMGILNSSDSEEVKKQKVGAVLGPLMNETVLGIIGAGIGGMTVGPGGAIVGGIAGGLLAGLAPNLAGNALAEFLMGRSTMSESQQNQIKSPNYITRKVSNLGTGMNNGQFQDIGSTIGLISPIKAPRNNYNQKLKNNMYNMSGVGDGGIGTINTGNKINSENYSSKTVNNNQTALISGSAIDLQDQYGLT